MFKAIGGIFGAIIAVIVCGLVIWGIVFGISWLTAGPNGKLQARTSINSGDNRIAQYDKFFALCTSVQTNEAAIKASEQQLKNTKNEDDKAIIQTNITAEKIARQDAVNTYNQDAAATYTQGQFLAPNLPARLPIDIPQGGTQCAA